MKYTYMDTRNKNGGGIGTHMGEHLTEYLPSNQKALGSITKPNPNQKEKGSNTVSIPSPSITWLCHLRVPCIQLCGHE
jgi:hypothetical protein